MHTIDTLNALLRRIPLATMAVVALLALFGALTFAALYSPSVGAQGLSGDATLSALSINDGTSDVDLNPAFTSTGTSYRTAVKYRGDRLTVTATTTSSNATIVFLDRSDGILDDADPNTSGRQVNVPIGGSIFKIKVTAQDGTAMEYEVVVERDSAYLFGWTPTRDLNHLAAAGNDSPQGIWSDGTTMWIADDDDDDDKLYAYTLATGVRDASKEFSLHNDNGNPKGIWSDGTTIWVADDGDDKLYAYTLSGGARESSKEFSLHTDNDAPWGIWSDGTTIWVTNGADPILYAYTLDNGARQDGTGGTTNMEFRLNGESLNARGIWSDGSTLWVSSSTYSETKPLVAYTLDLLSDGAIGILHGLPDWDKSFYTPGTLQLMGTGIWSDGNTAIWMASTGPAGKIYSFNTLPASAGGVSLSSLTINDGANNVELRPAFNSNDVVYWTSVVNDVSVVTVSATASDTAATVEYVNADADTVASGHQVDVVEGTTPIAILVAAADGAALIHFVIVERDSSRFGGWTPTKDIHGLGVAGRALPTGIWSDGDTMWVVYGSHDNLYAYTLDTGVRDASKEFSLHSDNGSPNGLWSDGQTIWVGDPSTPPTLFAYTLKDDTTTTGTDEKGQREPTKDITLEPLNFDVTGIWSNGTDTVWVADGFETRLFAYTLDIGPDGAAGPNHGARKADSDISTLENPGFRRGSWSDGTTLWVGDNTANYFRAYTLDTGEREESKDVPFAPYHLGNTGGIWSDGSTLWTAHQNTKRLPVAYSRIFSHTLPTSGGATTLSNLTVTSSPEVPSFTATLRPTFSPTKDIYRVALPNAAEFMTISPTLSDNAATATYQDKDGGTLVDADTINIGHQVSVPVGAFVINIKITKTGEPSITYTVVVERDSAEPFGWTPSKDLNTFYQDNPEAAGQVPRGVWGDETTLYVAPHNTAKVFAFNRSDGTRNQAKDIVVSSDFPIDGLGRLEPIIFAGIWSDGTTMWVVDYYRVHDEHGMDYEPSTAEQAHGKVFAYRLVDGERDKSKEFVLDSIHQASVRGVWSDGTTVWLSDWKLAKLIAYHLKDTPGTNGNEFGTRYEAKDITLHLDNDSPQGIWSDGTTIWVADWDDDKLYAYELATGVRAESQEFNLIPDNPYPRDVWSDGATMWVPDAGATKLFAYKMPPPPPAALSVAAAAAVEGEPLEFVVTLSKANAADTMVGYSVTGGTARAGTDYTAPAPGAVLTIPAGERTGTITIATLADETEEDPETLTLTLQNPVNARLDPAKSTATGTIRDVPDVLPAPRLPSDDDPNAIWLAKLTVASLGSNLYGYDSAQCGRGGLTDTAFTYLGDDTPILENQDFTRLGPLYTIDEVYYQTSLGKFYLSLDQRFAHDTADNIAVDVGGSRLSFGEVSSYSATEYTYVWSMPNPSWSVGDEVPVKIVVLKDADGPDGLAATTALVPHTGPTGHKYETRNLTLTWSAPTSGGAVTGYRVEYQPDPALQWRTLVRSQTGTTYTQSGKLRRVVDYYRVAALRSGGGVSYSDVVRVQVPPETPKIPERVGYLEAGPAACSNTALKIGWNRAYTLVTKSGDGVGSGVRATGYQVQYALDDGGYPYRIEGEDWLTVTLPRWLNGLSWRTWSGSIEEIEFRERRNLSPDLKTVVTGLAPDTNYQVRVRGCNDAGCGEWTIPKLAETSAAVSNATEADPLTASFASVPDTHDGESVFTFRIAFSEDVEITPEDMRDHALLVRGGTVTGAAGVDGRQDLWELTVEPSGSGPVSILVAQDLVCTETGALCTADGRSLTVSLALRVPGPPAPQANSVATGRPSITGTAQVGETLAAHTSDIGDDDGLASVSFSYQWIRNDGSTDTDIENATDSTYTLAAADEGQTIKVRVSFTDDAGNGETLTSTATEAVSFAVQQQQANSPATGRPAISGTAQVGETLAADTVGIGDDDGLTNVTYSYQWIRNDGSTDTDIENATDSTYTLAAADEGQTIQVRVSFTDDADNGETLTSVATGEVAAGGPTDPPGKPRNLTGAANADGTVTLSWDAPNDDTVTGYQILRRRPTEGEKTLLVHLNDTGSTATEYTDNDVTPDVGHAYRVKAINAVGLSRQSNFVNVTPTQPAEPAPNSLATGRPAISGTAQVGETLTADTAGIADADGLTNVSYSYQWIANDGTSDTDIQDATDSTYTLAAEDEGRTIKVSVSFTDDSGNEESLTSVATNEVANAGVTEPPAAPENLAAVENADGSVTLTWDDPGDDSVTGYRILRRNVDAGEPSVSSYVPDTGSAATSYTDRDVAAGTKYIYRVRAINEAGVGPRSGRVVITTSG